MIFKKTLTYNVGKSIVGIIKYNLRTMSTNDDIIFKSVENNGLIILNRPKALNALNLSMVNKMYPKLKEWETQKMLVLVRGTGEKAFCAGGDVRAIVEAGLRGERLGYDFFRNEYLLNNLIGLYKIPYISFIDGIVMGGGVGISVHGQYRIATEKTMFAMPETAIGLFPDVGGTFFLSRLKDNLGTYLALTGHRLKGIDVLKAGVATHYCKSQELNKLETDLLNCKNKQDISDILNKLTVSDGTPFSLEPVLSNIRKCFSAPTVESIFESLKEDGSEWAQKTLLILDKMSPTSLKVSHKAISLGSNMNLSECLKMEYRIAVRCLLNKDFYEGVRALLIDKDNKPTWTPKTVNEVTDTMVNSYFTQLPEDQELRHKL